MRLYRRPSYQFTIEVTESENAPRKSQFLKATTRIRLQGVNLAIDDFGTGFSSLTNLIDRPYNEIKIDTSYVQRMMTCKRCLAAVENVVALGQKLEMTIVAEGVEPQEQTQLLRGLGCNKLQGYRLSKPMGR
jgi:EAL domain-containing protein (putative c-di-GMP-specific phosphodiesterase class I)